MAICNLSFNFSASIPGGSGPYKTGVDVEVPTAGDMPAVLAAAVAWWSAATSFRALFAASMGAPLVVLRGEFGGTVVEEATQSASAPTGLTPDLPGVSLRAIKIGSRPVGGRRGSMFWPGLVGTETDALGQVDSGARTDAKVALDDLIADIEGSVVGAYVAQVHVVAGDETTTVVNEWTISPTMSWLNRRYR